MGEGGGGGEGEGTKLKKALKMTTPANFCSTNWRCSRTVLEHLELF